ncbi:sugar ABC transporter ATP-binding protein [Candidatus Magnetomorum sp. HK-1]|nr:sugar ABC transporter ATP-binding protein [Candidatus Magnetomorum sp. HK-1]
MIAIQACGISKQYRIGGMAEMNISLKEKITSALFFPVTCFTHSHRVSSSSKSQKYLWALKDISFDINAGEIVGIVGRNGSGKSTLLKILARITRPTRGYADIWGRLGCLLDAGVGFHSELTGRENIYLSGTTLGLKRREIHNKFDEIVEFSEIENYLDTPVKRYSSGMYLRLAFSVAAHLETEILLVDEILAVGDTAFQKKCLGKINDVAGEGRTVLFVSHDIQTMRRLCNRGLLLDHGKLTMDAPMTDILSAYAHTWISLPPEKFWNESMPGDEKIRLQSIRTFGDSGETAAIVKRHKETGIEIVYHLLKSNFWPALCLQFFSSEGIHLFSTHDLAAREKQKDLFKSLLPIQIREICWLPKELLRPGRIIVNVGLCSFSPVYTEYIMLKEVIGFDVIDETPIEKQKGPSEKKWYGVLQPELKWEISASGVGSN